MFSAAFIDEMSKVAKKRAKDPDSTASAVTRGARLGALLGGGAGAGLGALGGLTKARNVKYHIAGFSSEEMRSIRRRLSPWLKAANMGVGAGAHGARGALRGALLGGGIGFLTRPRKEGKKS